MSNKKQRKLVLNPERRRIIQKVFYLGECCLRPSNADVWHLAVHGILEYHTERRGRKNIFCLTQKGFSLGCEIVQTRFSSEYRPELRQAIEQLLFAKMCSIIPAMIWKNDHPCMPSTWESSPFFGCSAVISRRVDTGSTLNFFYPGEFTREASSQGGNSWDALPEAMWAALVLYREACRQLLEVRKSDDGSSFSFALSPRFLSSIMVKDDGRKYCFQNFGRYVLIRDTRRKQFNLQEWFVKEGCWSFRGGNIRDIEKYFKIRYGGDLWRGIYSAANIKEENIWLQTFEVATAHEVFQNRLHELVVSLEEVQAHMTTVSKSPEHVK